MSYKRLLNPKQQSIVHSLLKRRLGSFVPKRQDKNVGKPVTPVFKLTPESARLARRRPDLVGAIIRRRGNGDRRDRRRPDRRRRRLPRARRLDSPLATHPSRRP